MQEVKVILTWEAIYDIVEITDYIESDFDKINLMIYKKPFPPSIIFYVVNEPKNEIHIIISQNTIGNSPDSVFICHNLFVFLWHLLTNLLRANLLANLLCKCLYRLLTFITCEAASDRNQSFCLFFLADN